MRRLVRHGIVAASLCGMSVGVAVAAIPGEASTVEAVPILVASEASDPALSEEVASEIDTFATQAKARPAAPRIDAKAVANRAAALTKDRKSIAVASTKAKKAARKKAADDQKKAEEAAAKAAEEAAAKAKIPYDSNSSSPREIAKKILSDQGYSSNDFACFDNVIKRESGWNIHATNRSSGAYGLPQALPGSKMSSAGPDWRNSASTQIKWAIGYMESRYGGICSTWSHWQSHHNY